MNKKIGGGAGIFLLATGVMVCLASALAEGAGAQERPAQAKAAAVIRPTSGAPRATAYAAARETVVQGTILQYDEVAPAAPIGAHAKVQTTSGIVDVHLGPGSYLKARRFSLAAGDAVRFVGATATGKKGSVFLARTVERGGETLTLRSARGSLAANGGARAQAARDGAKNLHHGGAR